MIKSKLKQFTVSLFQGAILIAALGACVKAEKQNIYEDDKLRQTQFRMSRSEPVVDVTGYADNLITSGDVSVQRQADVSVTDTKNSSYSNRREYSLQLCGLQDIRANNSILGQKLKVYSELQIKDSELVIQNNSCVYWQVSLPYNYFGDSVNLYVNFVFKTVTGQKAYIHKKVLFNPWDRRRGSNPEVYDFTRYGLTDDLRNLPWAEGLDEIDRALAGTFLNSTKKLEISSVTINPVDKQRYVEGNFLGAEIGQDIEETKRRNEAEALRLALNNNQSFQTLDLHLNIRLNSLKVRLRDSAGVVHDQDLQTGRYRIYAQLLATDINNERKHYIISDKLIVSDEKNWNTTTMGVNAVLPLSLVMRPQWGNLTLALKVIPTDVPGIEPFEGLYNLGRFNELSGARSPLFDLSEYTRAHGSEDPTFSYDDYLKRAANYSDWEQGLAAQAAAEVSTLEQGFRRFQFSNLNVMFSRIMAGDTSTDRTIQYTVETCVIDNFTGARPGGGLRFEIETEDRGQKFKILRETNELGCLNWVGMISHKVYFRENLKLKTSKLTYLGNDSNRPVYLLDYYINPWDEKFTFGRDSRILPPEYIEQVREQQKVAPPTRILMTDFKYDATGFRYSIDKYMNMTVKKTVLMTIHPKILKYNSIVWGRSGSSEVRDGIYLLKIAMQKDYLDPAAPGRQILYRDGVARMRTQEQTIEKKQFLVVKEMLVRVLGGLIITPIEFDITDLRTLRIRSQMLIQIETIDEMLLRAVALADDKLEALLGHDGNPKTVEILGLQATQQQIAEQMAVAKQNADQAEMNRLMQEEAQAAERMRELLASLEPESLQMVLDRIKEISSYGESGVSVDRNIKFASLNNLLSSMRAKIIERQRRQQDQVQDDYEQAQATECAKMQSRLVNQGRVEEAKQYDPDNGELCKTSIPRDELFYYLTSPSNSVDPDAYLSALFTPEEFSLYQSNSLRDDFTKPYLPTYDFSLLSNQGDELFHDDGSPREGGEDETVSGLPRRTFIGPVTFVLNGNGSAMRPTDVLDEASCQGTCQQLEEVENSIVMNAAPVQEAVRRFGNPVNSSYEDSPYYGSVRHFYKKQVNDLILVERGLKHQYHQEMKAFSEVGNFLEQMQFNYMNFSNANPSVKSLDYECYSRWKADLESSYAKWRDGTDLSFNVQEISPSCFKPSARVFNRDAVLNQMNNPELPRWQYNLISPKILKDMKLPVVSTADFKEFSKNGLVSKKLSIDTKANILHKMCYHMRKKFFPIQNDKFMAMREEMTAVINRNTEESPFNLFGVLLDPLQQVAQSINFLRVEVEKFENDCHQAVNVFQRNIKNLGQVDDAVLRDVIAIEARKLPIVVERKVRVVETSDRYIYKDGKTLNYSVGTSFSLSNSFNVNRGYKIDPIESIEKGAGALGGWAWWGGVSAAASKVFSTMLGAASGFLNFQWGTNEGVNDSNGTSVSAGTTLAGQISTLDIELSKWEKCVIVRFEENGFLDLLEKFRARFNFYDANRYMQSLGTMMCSGEEDSKDDLRSDDKPLRIRERYYYFTQIFNDGDMQDSGSLVNHPWMLQLRGMRDFTRFHKALVSTGGNLNWGSAYGRFADDTSSILFGNEDGKRELSPMMVVDHEDVEKSLNMMSEAYSRALPTFPGMYTFSESSEDDVTSWSNE